MGLKEKISKFAQNTLRILPSLAVGVGAMVLSQYLDSASSQPPRYEIKKTADRTVVSVIYSLLEFNYVDKNNDGKFDDKYISGITGETPSLSRVEVSREDQKLLEELVR